MKNTYKILPVYTGDVSGVCSALYELGGMVVMHDPSGCNSTYNTHDEIRWYDQDSRIYLSGLSEMDAVMGSDEKFIDDVCRAAGENPPEFIALAGSPIPFLNGTDLPALARIIEERTGIPAFSIPTNGMHDYVYGAGLALAEIARRFTGNRPEENKTDKTDFSNIKLKKQDEHSLAENQDMQKKEHRQEHALNLLGVTPLDFGPVSNVNIMKENLKKCGWNVLSCWAMGDDLKTLARSNEAEVNLVVSSVGLEAAKVLEEKFGTPYVVGTPIGDYTKRIAEALANREQFPYITDRTENRYNLKEHAGGEICLTERKETGLNRNYLNCDIKTENKEEIILAGEPVTMGSLAAAIEHKYHRRTKVLCPLHVPQELLAPCDHFAFGEEEMESSLRGAKTIIADLLYRPVCPKECSFYELPHIAFSGRIFLKKLTDLPWLTFK